MASDAIDVIKSIERKKFIEEEIPALRNRALLLGVDIKEYIL